MMSNNLAEGLHVCYYPDERITLFGHAYCAHQSRFFPHQ